MVPIENYGYGGRGATGALRQTGFGNWIRCVRSVRVPATSKGGKRSERGTASNWPETQCTISSDNRQSLTGVWVDCIPYCVQNG